MRSPESFEEYHARCVRGLDRVRRDGGQDDPGGQHRLAWYEARVEATLLDDGELAQAIEATGPVHPHIASEDIRAVRRHALVDEQRRRERRTAHERIAEAGVRRRLRAEKVASEPIGPEPAADGGEGGAAEPKTERPERR